MLPGRSRILAGRTTQLKNGFETVPLDRVNAPIP